MEAERPRLRRFRRRVTPPCFRLHHNGTDWSFRTPNQYFVSLLPRKTWRGEKTRARGGSASDGVIRELYNRCGLFWREPSTSLLLFLPLRPFSGTLYSSLPSTSAEGAKQSRHEPEVTLSPDSVPGPAGSRKDKNRGSYHRTNLSP